MNFISKINIFLYFSYFFLGYEISVIFGTGSLILIMIIPLSLEMILYGIAKKTLKIVVDKSSIFLFLFFSLIFALNVLHGLPFILSFFTLIFYLINLTYLLYVFNRYCLQNSWLLDKFLTSLCIAFALIIFPFIKSAPLVFGGFYLMPFIVAHIPFYDSNFTLPFVNSLLFLSSFVLFKTNKTKWGFIILITTLVNFLLLRRGAIVFSLLAIIAYKMKVKPIFILIGSIVMPFVIYFYFSGYLDSSSFESLASVKGRGNTQGSNLERLSLFIIAMKSIVEYDILSPNLFFGNLKVVMGLREDVQYFHVHNTYLNMIVYFGLVGLVSWASIIWFSLRGLSSNKGNPTYNALFICFVYLILQINTESLFININFMNVFFLFNIVALSHYRLIKTNSQ